MKILKIDQGTPAWKIWRTKGLGATTSPIILGDSPWSTPFTLWAELCGFAAKPDFNAYQLKAMDRGSALEPMVRAKFEAQFGKKFDPIVCEHDDHPWMRASLDGWNDELKAVLEIKCPSKIDHEKALKGKVPDKYVAQLAHQAIVTGAAISYYVSYYSEEMPLAVVEVKPDPVYNKILLEKAIEFWNHVQKQTPPSFGKNDVIAIFKTTHTNYEKFNKSFAVLKLLVDSMEDSK